LKTSRARGFGALAAALFIAASAAASASCLKESLDSTAFVGPNGGEIISADKSVRIVVPKGALSYESKYAIESLPAFTSAQIGRAWRVNPSLSLAEGAAVTVYLSAGSAEFGDANPDTDVVAMGIKGSDIYPLLTNFALDVENKVAVFDAAGSLNGFALIDYGCSKSCLKKAVCAGAQYDESCSVACRLRIPLDDWRALWCQIGESCERLDCCINPALPVCSAKPDGDEEEDIEEPADGDDEEATEEPVEEEIEIDAESELEPDKEIEPDPDWDYIDGERVFNPSKRCFTDNDCNKAAGEICFVAANLCYLMPKNAVRRYEKLSGSYISVSGEPNLACIGQSFAIKQNNPATVKVTATVTTLGLPTSAENIYVSVSQFTEWFNEQNSPVASGTTNAQGKVVINDVPTNAPLVFQTFRLPGELYEGLYQAANTGIIIPAEIAQAAGEEGVSIEIFALNRATVSAYASYVGIETMPKDGGIAWLVLRDCDGFSLSNGAGLFWEHAAAGTLYMSRELTAAPEKKETDPPGHVVFFDMPKGNEEIRFAGILQSGGTPAILAQEKIPVLPGTVVFVQLNRLGWITSPK